jgi:translation elongation factor EF-1beta
MPKTFLINSSFVSDAPIAKSNIILAVKGWSDETDFEEIEKVVRAVEHLGLTWGACKLTHVCHRS